MSTQYIENKSGLKLACNYTPAGTDGLPAVMFLGGFKSDMEGTKAIYLEERCKARGQEFLRFDYSGHGISEGTFEDGTIGQWRDDARTALNHFIKGPVILVGSSMGGWISLLIARALSEEGSAQLSGLIGLAAAPDFTRDITNQLSDAQKDEMVKNGFVAVPNDYSDDPYIFTRALIEDGEKNCLLDAPLPINAPVCLIQGMQDADVEWQKAFRIKNTIDQAKEAEGAGADNENVEVVLLEDADHRLSTPENLALIDQKVMELSALNG